MSEGDYGINFSSDREWRGELPLRIGRWIARTAQPYRGWLVFACCCALATLPAWLVFDNRWLYSSALMTNLILLGPLAICTTWLVAGWRKPWRHMPGWLRQISIVIVYLVVGAVVWLQLLANWLPTYVEWRLILAGAGWTGLVSGIVADLQQLATRFGMWWQGVLGANAARDDLVLVALTAALIWLMAGLTGWITRRFGRGFAAGVPILWPLGFVMLYSPAGRWLFVVAMGLTLLLHLVLDQQRLVREWVGLKLDYSPSLLVERALYALAIFGLVLTVALLTPNLYVYEVTARYYTWLRPVNQGMEAIGKRLFPGVAGVMPWEPRTGAGTPAREFALGAGASQGVREVMRVRTSEPVSGAGFDAAPPGHTLRGITYSTYAGRVWENPGLPIIRQLPAEQPWNVRAPYADRRELVQSVNLAAPGGILFAAAEPQAPSIDYIAQERFPGDLIDLRARVRSYTVVSELPMLSAAELARLPAWDAGVAPVLPEEYRIFLQLPATVTERTRRLATELTADAANPFAAATAIETYLRRYPYDLEVPELPDHVTDVADYFLFDLNRGYCDYYATAFVVLARLAGLPARLVTGYAPGSWLPAERLWVVTERDAHAWPEVYFPEAGWIAFEPTAARPPLVRLAGPEAAGMGGAQPVFEPLPPPPAGFSWLWVFAGLALLAGAIPAVVWFQQRARREDPWLGLLRWGTAAGRPLEEGETPLEYGKRLGEWLEISYPAQADNVRVAMREVESLSRDVSAVQYAPARDRSMVRDQAVSRWQRLRQYLRKLGRR